MDYLDIVAILKAHHPVAIDAWEAHMLMAGLVLLSDDETFWDPSVPEEREMLREQLRELEERVVGCLPNETLALYRSLALDEDQ